VAPVQSPRSMHVKIGDKPVLLAGSLFPEALLATDVSQISMVEHGDLDALIMGGLPGLSAWTGNTDAGQLMLWSDVIRMRSGCARRCKM
jgi:hypothetical protein